MAEGTAVPESSSEAPCMFEDDLTEAQQTGQEPCRQHNSRDADSRDYNDQATWDQEFVKNPCEIEHLSSEEAAKRYAGLGIPWWSWNHNTTSQFDASVFADVPQGNLQLATEDISDIEADAHEHTHAADFQHPGSGTCMVPQRTEELCSEE